MPFEFNKQLWDIGQKIEDDTLPVLNRFFNANFKRNNDIFDILDFHDEEKKIICEVKGRRNKHDKYPETIITCGKFSESLMKIDQGYRVYFIFSFTDKIMGIEVLPDADFKVCITGTNMIKHYLIPVKDLKDIDDKFLS